MEETLVLIKPDGVKRKSVVKFLHVMNVKA